MGTGEYFSPPSCKSFQWLKLEEFYEKLLKAFEEGGKGLKESDKRVVIIDEWLEALKNELERRREVDRGEKCNIESFRAGGWNLTFLGQLSNGLANVLPVDLLKTLRVFPYGTKPDTILNFGWKDGDGFYSEINSNGKLNVKVWLTDNPKDHAQVESRYRVAVTNLEKRGIDRSNLKSLRLSKTMTLVSLDVGIGIEDDLFCYKESMASTIELLSEALYRLYSDNL